MVDRSDGEVGCTATHGGWRRRARCHRGRNDLDGDGTADVIEISADTDGDGEVDTVITMADTDGDGERNGGHGNDLDGDGEMDVVEAAADATATARLTPWSPLPIWTPTVSPT